MYPNIEERDLASSLAFVLLMSSAGFHFLGASFVNSDNSGIFLFYCVEDCTAISIPSAHSRPVALITPWWSQVRGSGSELSIALL